MRNNKITAVVQARYNSVRFPGKILSNINGRSALEILLLRLKKSKNLTNIIISTTNDKRNISIKKICKKLNIKYFSGSENNVLDRYYKTALKFNIKNVIRITSDCPLIDPSLLDSMIKVYFEKKADYLSNTNPPTYPDGLDIEIFKFSALKKAWLNAKKSYDKEHVTPFLKKNNKLKKINFKNDKDYSKVRITLDEKSDLEVIRGIFKYFKNNIYFNLNDIIKLYKSEKKLFLKNMHLKRNYGGVISYGQKVWKRAQQIIPGGTMLYSKNPNLFLPNFWPTYYTKARGYSVWDLQGKKYSDLSSMGVGTNILGYAKKEIDDAVIKAIQNSNMSSLNCYEEVSLAEKLIEINPWAHMVKYARTGAEANSIAIRIARATTGKNKIAICGYHGWHDWYLAANLDDDQNLNNHLMRNLKINGVNKNLRKSVLTFDYNDFKGAKKILSSKDVAAVIMEVSRNVKPQNNFLKKIRSLTKNKNIILIFDECTSGFRENLGGLHRKFNVTPDIAVFGKALGNGYAITAVVGIKEVMENANSSFISSTFWTERIGPTAALKTIELMKKTQSWKIITEMGIKFKKQIKKIADKNKIKINIQGLDAMPKFEFDHEDKEIFTTFLSQEMLKKNILATNFIYFCINHDENIMKKYYECLDEVFFKISKTIKENISTKNLLEGPIKTSGLRYRP